MLEQGWAFENFPMSQVELYLGLHQNLIFLNFVFRIYQ